MHLHACNNPFCPQMSFISHPWGRLAVSSTNRNEGCWGGSTWVSNIRWRWLSV